MFGGLAAVTIMTVIGDVFPPEKRGRATGAVMSAFAVASIVGMPIGLLLAEWYGRGAPFVALAALSARGVGRSAAFRLPRVREHLGHARRHPLHEFAAVVRSRTTCGRSCSRSSWCWARSPSARSVAPYLAATNGWTEDDLAVIYLVAGVLHADRDERGRAACGPLPPAVAVPRARGDHDRDGAGRGNLPPCPLWVATLALSAFMVFAAGRIVPAQAMLGAASRGSAGRS